MSTAVPIPRMFRVYASQTKSRVVSFWILTALLLARFTETRAIEVTPGEMAEARR